MPVLRTAAATAAAFAALVSLPAAPGGGARAAVAPRSCFYISQITNTRGADARTLYVRVGGSRVYRMDMRNECPGLAPTSETIIFEPTPSGSICGPMSLDITVTSHGTSQRCLIGQITKLTPDEVAALPKAVTP